MSTANLPISPDEPICQTLTCLPEKFIVDFANGIDVVHDHLRVQRMRTGFAQRLWDGFTGTHTRRQNAMQASLVDGVEASLNWLCELSETVAHSNLAIAKVNDRVTNLTSHVTTLVGYSATTRRQLEHVASRLEARIQDINEEVARIDFIQKVQLNLDKVFSKWDAGHFAVLSPAARCYVALEELRWGALGDFCRAHASQRESFEFMDLAVNRATKQLAGDIGESVNTPARTDEWLRWPPMPRFVRDGVGDLPDAVAYLADGVTAEAAPFVVSAVRHPSPLPQALPLIANAHRVAKAMAEEVFAQEMGYV